MARYDYKCIACGKMQEITCKMGEAPLVAVCTCGKEAVRHFTVPDCVVKGSYDKFQYDPKYTIPSIGRNVRSDRAQDRLYKKIVAEAKKTDRAHRKSMSGKKGECYRIGKMPLEINEYITEMTGDPHAVSKDPEYWHKATGTWTGPE